MGEPKGILPDGFSPFTQERGRFAQVLLIFSPQMWYIQSNLIFYGLTISFHRSKEVFVCCLIVSLRCVFWVGLFIRVGGIDSPRPASQRAAALVLTAALLTGAAFPAFAGTYYIEDGDIVISAGTETGTNKVEQGGTLKSENDKGTIITNHDKDKASSNTVTIDANGKNDKVEVTLKDVNIDASRGSEAAVSVTGGGDTNIELEGDNALKSGAGHAGLEHNKTDTSGELTIQDENNDGSLDAAGGFKGAGIGSSGSNDAQVKITGGNITATGGDWGAGIGSGSYGTGTDGTAYVEITGGEINATGGYLGAGIGGGCNGSGNVTVSGGENDSLTAQGGSGANGISSSGSLTISGGTVTANGDDGGHGIYSRGGVTISGGSTVTANGESGTISGGDGICSSGGVIISGGSTVTANGGNGGSIGGGSGIYSNGSLTISGGTVNANGGSGKNGNGGNGIIGSGRVAISGGTVNAAGGDGTNSNGGEGIYGRKGIDLSGSLELTAKAGSPNGKALSQDGHELDLNTIKEKLDPGAKVTAINANGDSKQVSIPRPVEPEEPVIPEESSSSSDGGSATPSTPASPLPGLTVTDKDGQRISYTSIRGNNVLSLRVGRFTASLRASLSTLRQLRAEGIDTITFQTILCSTTLSVDELLAMGGEDAEIVLTHHIRSSTLTVGGKAV